MTADTGWATGTEESGAVADCGYGRAFARFYDRLFPQDGSDRVTAAALAGLHPGGATLELGVGTGRIAVPLSALVGEVTGVDSSPEMLDRLRKAVASTGARVRPVHGDIRVYEDGAGYGLVYCVCGTLSQILTPEEQRAAVLRAARRLAPGGTLVVETHNPGFVAALHEGRLRASFYIPYPEPGTGVQTYSTLIPERTLWHTTHLWHEGGNVHPGTEITRLTTPEEVDRYAEQAGLVPVSRWGDWSGGAFDEASSPVHISRYTAAGNGGGR
ncbi:class I SAM-dependent methyltransferase [Nocardiopsis sp. NPDC006139]|uniref:class I SAM-dependent methyltransferase n=1 Tax=Nocardiopsis sp. NPDC006139 TaxID=3154578 RepID=UPI0033A03DD2